MRNIKSPQEFAIQNLQGYCMVTKADLASAISNKLTASQWKLWAYLMMLDPFADHTKNGEKIYKPLPSPQAIAIQIGLCYDTVVKDMRKLRKFGLYDYRVTGWQGYNQSAHHAKEAGHKKAKTQIQQPLGLINPIDGLNNPTSGLNNPDDGLNNPPNGLNNPSLIAESPPHKDYSSSQTIQTKQTKHTLSNEKQKQFSFKFSQEETQSKQNLLIAEDKTSNPDNIQNSSIESNLSRSSIAVVANSVNVYNDWLPDGVWKTSNGELDPSFCDWLARKWVARYQNCDLLESIANVKCYFKNDPAKLPIQWEYYQQEYLAKVDNVKVRLDNGCNISPQEQVRILSQINAIKPCNQSSSSPVNVYTHNNALVKGSSVPSNEEVPVNPTALKRLREYLLNFSSPKIQEA